MNDQIIKLKTMAEFGAILQDESLPNFLSAKIAGLGTELWALVHLENQVFFEKIIGHLPQSIAGISRNALRECRIFSEKGELHLWNCSGEIGWRLRTDDNGVKTEVSDKKQILWGNKVKSDAPCVLKEDGRGCEIRMPVYVSEEQLPLSITVRNYITYDEDGLLYINDARIIEINTKNGGKL